MVIADDGGIWRIVRDILEADPSVVSFTTHRQLSVFLVTNYDAGIPLDSAGGVATTSKYREIP